MFTWCKIGNSLLNLVGIQIGFLGFWLCHVFWTKNCVSCGCGKAPPPRRQAGARTQEAGCPGCLEAVFRPFPGCFQAVSMLSPCCLQAVSRLFLVFLPFLNFKSVLIVSFYFLFACQSAISHGFVPLRLAIPLTCEEATAVTFYRSSWLRKLACCWCLNVWLPYITV
jgi:hypothetical protein